MLLFSFRQTLLFNCNNDIWSLLNLVMAVNGAQEFEASKSPFIHPKSNTYDTRLYLMNVLRQSNLVFDGILSIF